jgi:hypothetical protein
VLTLFYFENILAGSGLLGEIYCVKIADKFHIFKTLNLNLTSL